jgi:hypothetical protein
VKIDELSFDGYKGGVLLLFCFMICVFRCDFSADVFGYYEMADSSWNLSTLSYAYCQCIWIAGNIFRYLSVSEYPS